MDFSFPKPPTSNHLRSEHELVTDCRRGCSAAWNILWDQYFHRLPTVALAVGLSNHDAHQLVADLFSRLWVDTIRHRDPKGLFGFAGRGSLLGWLRVIVRRQAMRLLRQESNLRVSDQIDDLPALTLDPAEGIARREEDEAALTAIEARRSRLSARESRVVNLKYDAGLSQSEIARQLRIGEPRVSRIHQRALAKLLPPRRVAV